jgi:hypothetical protein
MMAVPGGAGAVVTNEAPNMSSVDGTGASCCVEE